MAVGVIPLAEVVISLLERRVNPILDLSTLHLPLRLTGVRIKPGCAVITGTALFSIAD